MSMRGGVRARVCVGECVFGLHVLVFVPSPIFFSACVFPHLFFFCFPFYILLYVRVRAPSWPSCGGTSAWLQRRRGRCQSLRCCPDKWAWSVWLLWPPWWRARTPPTGDWRTVVVSLARASGAASWSSRAVAALRWDYQANDWQVCKLVTRREPLRLTRVSIMSLIFFTLRKGLFFRPVH